MIGLASLPGLGIFLGTALAEKINASDKLVSIALHWTAGMMLGVVGVEIMPKILKTQPAWPMIFIVLAGGFLAIAVDKLIDKFSGGGGKWTILFAVATDMFADGITIGASANISSNFATLVVFGLFIGDFPEGLVNTTTFKNQDTKRKFRLLVALGVSVICLAGASSSYLITKGGSDLLKNGFIAFTAGMYLRAAVEDMIEKSHSKTGKNFWNQAFFILGFVAYMAGSIVLKK